MSEPYPAALLQCEGLVVRLGGRIIVEDVNLALRRGELLALVGPNGAGKTTLLRALAGLVGAQGRIALDGRPLAALSARERARTLAYLPQGHVFDWPLSAAAVVALGRHPHADPFGRTSQADALAVERAMAATGTLAFSQRSIATLSGGERARIALARALATEAPVLLADEPTASLDPRHQLIVMQQLRRSALGGGAVLAVMHDLMLAARFADRVLVMDEGRIVADAPPAHALSPALLARVFAVEAVLLERDGVPMPLIQRPL